MMIPKVQTWRIAWWQGRDRLDVAYVQAPTKTLARDAIERDHVDLILRNRNADRVTYQVACDRWSPR
jgi:hypothetical protein